MLAKTKSRQLPHYFTTNWWSCRQLTAITLNKKFELIQKLIFHIHNIFSKVYHCVNSARLIFKYWVIFQHEYTATRQFPSAVGTRELSCCSVRMLKYTQYLNNQPCTILIIIFLSIPQIMLFKNYHFDTSQICCKYLKMQVFTF